MSAFGRFGGWVKGLFGDVPQSAGGLLAGISTGGVAPRRGTRELLLAYKRLPYLQSAMHKIASDVASVPFRLYRPTRGRSSKAFTQGGSGQLRRKFMEDAKQSGDLEEITAHPMLDWLARFNPHLRAHSTRVVSQLYLDLIGDAPIVLERNGLGQPVEGWPVPPTWITDLPTSTSQFYRASYQGWQRLIPAADMLWLKHVDPENPYARGTGIGVALGDELDIDEAAGAHVKGWFNNHGLPSALVSMDIGQTEMDRFKEGWEQDLKGKGKAGLVKFVGAKDLKVQELGDSFKEQQLVELRKGSREVVMQTLNIPPECMGIVENSNRATIDAALTLYGWGVLCPRLDFWCDQLQPMAETFDEKLVIDYPSPIPEDRDFRAKVMAGVPTVFTVDEHRGLAGAAPLPEGEGEALYEGPAAVGFGFGGGEPDEDPADPPEPDEDDEEDPAPDDEEKSLRGRSVQRAADGGGSTFSESDLSRTLEALRPERLSHEVRPVWQARVDAWGKRVLAELGVDVAFNIRNPLVHQHIEHFAGTKIRGVTDTTRDALRSQLTEGIALGEGIADLQKRVGLVFGVADKSRARLIARTEVVGSSNFANLTAFELSGVVESKEWLSVPDENTRDSHRELDGTVIKLSEYFEANGHKGKCPGSFGVPEEDIQCRCSVLPVVADVKASAEDRVKIWKRFDARAASWERVAISALRRGFRAQEAAVLAAMT